MSNDKYKTTFQMFFDDIRIELWIREIQIKLNSSLEEIDDLFMDRIRHLKDTDKKKYEELYRQQFMMKGILGEEFTKKYENVLDQIGDTVVTLLEAEGHKIANEYTEEYLSRIQKLEKEIK